jgi:hypothetical protein
MSPAAIAMADTFAAALRQQISGTAFSRAEALRIAAMEWLQARQARGTPAPSQRAPAAAPAAPAPGPGGPPPPAAPLSRQGQILAALTAAGTPGLRPAAVRQAPGLPPGTVARARHGLGQRGQVRTGAHRDAGDNQSTSIAGPASFPRRSHPEEPRHGGQGDARRGIIPRFSMLSRLIRTAMPPTSSRATSP